jgi:hypothetical protein
LGPLLQSHFSSGGDTYEEISERDEFPEWATDPALESDAAEPEVVNDAFEEAGLASLSCVTLDAREHWSVTTEAVAGLQHGVQSLSSGISHITDSSAPSPRRYAT